jgi:hypothetical protein
MAYVKKSQFLIPPDEVWIPRVPGRPKDNGMLPLRTQSHLYLQNYSQYVQWYIQTREKQRDYGLPIVAPEYFDVKPVERQQVSSNPQVTNLSKPHVPDAWSSMNVQPRK